MIEIKGLLYGAETEVFNNAIVFRVVFASRYTNHDAVIPLNRPIDLSKALLKLRLKNALFEIKKAKLKKG